MEREAVTIRFPSGLLETAKSFKDGNESFNDLVIDAVERELRRRKGIAAHQRIVARSQKIKNRTDTQESSIDLIRNLREGKERRD
ncbi:MAG: hypothetical protein KME29_00155 [Calothrix sp. FI2-JRJ7]|nr:hypothetical protein [Calothrix sp. FI2-JRJ7]